MTTRSSGRRLPWRMLGLWCGVAGPVAWLSLILVLGAVRPGYSHASHYISELGARGSPHALLMRVGGFGFSGLMYFCFALTLRHAFAPIRGATLGAALIALNGVGRIGAGAFPCEPGCNGLTTSQQLHHQFASIGFIAGVLAAFAWAFVLRSDRWFRGVRRYLIGAGLTAALALVALQVEGESAGRHGLFELSASTLLSSWIAVLAAGSILRERSRDQQWSGPGSNR